MQGPTAAALLSGARCVQFCVSCGLRFSPLPHLWVDAPLQLGRHAILRVPQLNLPGDASVALLELDDHSVGVLAPGRDRRHFLVALLELLPRRALELLRCV